ncbi:MAG: hypothetical protein HYS08_02295 [Chlamydiae bacterium]|nr:hypothetical protein [Chlamydiota bacterium]MBI3266706.1 hypothetical protein [Chlamydiota bacterium]
MKQCLMLGVMSVIALMMAGCSDFEDPTKKISLETVVGGGPSLKLGMTKDEVKASWGNPDNVKATGENRWGAPREEWTYHAWFPVVPVNYKYVSKGRRLFFEGDALVKWEETEVEQTKTEDRGQKTETSTKEPETQN